MKKFQKTISLCLAVLLTVLSVHARTAERVIFSESTLHSIHHDDPIEGGTRMIYAFDSNPQEVLIETEVDVKAFGPDFINFEDSSEFDHTLKYLSLLENSHMLFSSDHTSYKKYLRKLIFPYHSYW